MPLSPLCHYDRYKAQVEKIQYVIGLHLTLNPWEKVDKSTIRNCFTKAEFITEEIKTESQDENVQDHGEIELYDFLKEIVEAIMCSEESGESEDEGINVVERVISFSESPCVWSTTRKFVEERSDITYKMEACDRLENEMQVIHQKKISSRDTTKLQPVCVEHESSCTVSIPLSDINGLIDLVSNPP
ncbi:hypothetical protein RF11_04622 [Thelohanellus kitauei]|uniref:Uncharacterized protein n=1 Tax=Thelohanellus kitauei TaxID=669202 RepID=A0A0C2NC76_THEKT|nr:hypothetical protein RF11_04622 [Thelohanellus kitauei]